MSPHDLDAPVLVLGGSGVVGTRAVAALRRLYPELPIVLGARDLARAGAVARELGHASAVAVDLTRPDLGMPPDRSFRAVVTLVKDASLGSLRHALARGLPYVSFSEFAFDIAPTVALYLRAPRPAPVLLLGHFLGGTITAASLGFADEFRRVDSVEIGAVFDEQDVGGPAAQGDPDRIRDGVPAPLVRIDGAYRWASGAAAARSFVGVGGRLWRGGACSLLDVPALGAATGAANVRVDFAVRPAAERPGSSRSHEVIVELAGEGRDGQPLRTRHELVVDDVHAGPSAVGVAIAVERLLGLHGGPAVAPGLYGPEQLIAPAHALARLAQFGVRVSRA